MKRWALVISCWLAVAGCQRDTWAPTLQQRVDSAARAQGITAKKVTFEGPVTFTHQTGSGHTATSSAVDNTKAGKKADAAAIGPGSSASATRSGTPGSVYLLLVGLCLILGAGLGGWVRGKWPW